MPPFRFADGRREGLAVPPFDGSDKAGAPPHNPRAGRADTDWERVLLGHWRKAAVPASVRFGSKAEAHADAERMSAIR